MDFLACCEEMAQAVSDAITPLVGTPEAGTKIKMGADGTPTQQIDLVAEECILAYLNEKPLGRTLVSEEAGRVDLRGNSGTIFLDPIDGTYNAVKGIPFFALSIAYAKKGIVQEAFVQNLATGETFTARKGMGAFLNEKPIAVSETTSLDESTFSIYGRKFDPGKVLHLGQKIRRWRLLGASALELCYIGCGRIDGFIDLRGTLRVTDAAAGVLVCTEAGGTVSDLDGCPLVFFDEVTIGKCLVATNGVMHRKVIEYLR
ncbi:MAG: bifunctional fructose-bisphosphatase/inositol-phosphate phosphatase [Methanoregulaceae archaeon]|nr:bifunctional fructose-bisphosphatase/inositol-phosphate phosphatase [Methanoregulaceae archaeon]